MTDTVSRNNVIELVNHLNKRVSAHDKKLASLTAMPIEQLKSLWDRYDGGNAPDEYDGEDIHKVLNMRGCGEYCAV